MDQQEEAHLIASAKNGDEAAFLALFRHHHEPVFRFAYRFTGSEDMAGDLTQDCFASLFSGWKKYDPARGPLRAYLYGAVRNLARKRFRDYGKETSLEDCDGIESIADPAMPLDQALKEEVSSAVQKAVLALPVPQREALLLFEYEGLSLSEVAATLGLETGTVKSRLHRARERLKRTLAVFGEQSAAKCAGDGSDHETTE